MTAYGAKATGPLFQDDVCFQAEAMTCFMTVKGARSCRQVTTALRPFADQIAAADVIGDSGQLRSSSKPLDESITRELLI